jgi:FMN phosphatase YigB (HAD superfamily)
MIRVILLDLGGTLVRENPLQVWPHVPQALIFLNSLSTPAGDPIAVCLVSNFRPSPEELEAFTNQYIGLLDTLNLRQYFEPVATRVTLSTHTMTWKPDRRVFELAIRRSGTAAELHECLLITEDSEHIAAARTLGMHTLQFMVDFQDWNESPGKISALLASLA